LGPFLKNLQGFRKAEREPDVIAAPLAVRRASCARTAPLRSFGCWIRLLIASGLSHTEGKRRVGFETVSVSPNLRAEPRDATKPHAGVHDRRTCVLLRIYRVPMQLDHRHERCSTKQSRETSPQDPDHEVPDSPGRQQKHPIAGTCLGGLALPVLVPPKPPGFWWDMCGKPTAHETSPTVGFLGSWRCVVSRSNLNGRGGKLAAFQRVEVILIGQENVRTKRHKTLIQEAHGERPGRPKVSYCLRKTQFSGCHYPWFPGSPRRP
jgi:hypothetical protein